jgi:hypothetical protein
MTVLASICAAVAALAALLALRYARQTVRDGRTGQDAFQAAHQEAMAAQQRALAAFNAAQKAEMVARNLALNNEVSLQRLAQAARITEILISIARTAYNEAISPTQPVPGSRRPSFIPTEQAHLRAALQLFVALGGPALDAPEKLSQLPFSMTTPASDVRRLAEESLGEISRLAGHDDGLKIAGVISELGPATG